MQKQVNKNHYFNQKYNHKARWLSYWYQVDLVLSTEARSVLEIGLGSAVVSQYLKKAGLELKTLDIDPELSPDIVGSIESIPLGDGVVDCVLAAEVLEHLPYEKFIPVLSEIARVSRRYAVISVPDARRTLCSWYWKIPFLKPIIVLWKIASGKVHKFDGQHYWELGKRGSDVKKIKNDIIKSGWKVVKSFTPQDVPTKIFFLLEKIHKNTRTLEHENNVLE